jgi:hypothetical protein
MSITSRNPFADLRAQLVAQNKPGAIATRLAYCVLAAKHYRQVLQLIEVLDMDGGFLCSAYVDAFRSEHFRSNKDWHYEYARLREHALSFLDTRRHLAYA